MGTNCKMDMRFFPPQQMDTFKCNETKRNTFYSDGTVV